MLDLPAVLPVEKGEDRLSPSASGYPSHAESLELIAVWRISSDRDEGESPIVRGQYYPGSSSLGLPPRHIPVSINTSTRSATSLKCALRGDCWLLRCLRMSASSFSDMIRILPCRSGASRMYGTRSSSFHSLYAVFSSAFRWARYRLTVAALLPFRLKVFLILLIFSSSILLISEFPKSAYQQGLIRDRSQYPER